jgi:hypothetical protein
LRGSEYKWLWLRDVTVQVFCAFQSLALLLVELWEIGNLPNTNRLAVGTKVKIIIAGRRLCFEVVATVRCTLWRSYGNATFRRPQRS